MTGTSMSLAHHAPKGTGRQNGWTRSHTALNTLSLSAFSPTRLEMRLLQPFVLIRPLYSQATIQDDVLSCRP